MPSEDIHLIHQQHTLAGVEEYLRNHMDVLSFDAFEHILDFHFAHEKDVSARLEGRDFIGLARCLNGLAHAKLDELPSDIARHNYTWTVLEDKALRIIILRHLAHHAPRYRPGTLETSV